MSAALNAQVQGCCCVIEKYNGGPPKPYIYQAVEFRKGSELPEIEKENMSRKQLRATWVLGVAYAPALYVRKQSRREKGYLFHSDASDTDARTGLFWKCQEVVRVDNSTAWPAMSSASFDSGATSRASGRCLQWRSACGWSRFTLCLRDELS